jgi:type I restriction enzyme, S subunit
MQTTWKDATLDDVCERITDGAHASPKSVEQGLPMASVKDMTPFGLNLNSARRISEDDFAKLVRQGCKPLVGDVLIAKDGATALDTVCLIKRPVEAVLLSSVAILRPKTGMVLPQYLRYYLDAEPTRQYMKASFTTGAAIPRVVLRDFKRARIRYPDQTTQHRIASILSAYDDLIENNTRRIAILEEMARRLYEEWFVRFRFPGHEGVRLVESELGLVPEGWDVVRLDQVLVLQRGFDLPKQDRIEGRFSIISSTGSNATHHECRVKGPGVVTGRSGSLGVVMYVEDDFWPLNTTLWVKQFIVGSPLYAFFVLRSIDLAGFNSGSAVPTLNRNDIHGLPVVRPSPEVLARFDAVVGPILSLKERLVLKNQNLSTTRNLLLPKLISGELDVSTLPEPQSETA